jgi:heme/copper-type cytochrome/quinol oxidase subunit 2
MTSAIQSDNKIARLRGAALLIIGVALLKWQIYDPLTAADRRVQSVWLSSKLVALAIILPVFGFFLVSFGSRASHWVAQGLSFKDWKSTLRVLALVAICIVADTYIERKLYAEGYHR